MLEDPTKLRTVARPTFGKRGQASRDVTPGAMVASAIILKDGHRSSDFLLTLAAGALALSVAVGYEAFRLKVVQSAPANSPTPTDRAGAQPKLPWNCIIAALQHDPMLQSICPP